MIFILFNMITCTTDLVVSFQLQAIAITAYTSFGKEWSRRSRVFINISWRFRSLIMKSQMPNFFIFIPCVPLIFDRFSAKISSSLNTSILNWLCGNMNSRSPGFSQWYHARNPTYFHYSHLKEIFALRGSKINRTLVYKFFHECG